MKKLMLQEVQWTELSLLKHFREFCVANGIQYYLSNGTLLGAIKYRGFIPWDDDVDVVMMRKDYERLLQIYQDSESFWLVSADKYPDYPLPFAKLCDKTTILQNGVMANHQKTGVCIDVFPLDYWPDDKKQARQMAQCCCNWLHLLGFSVASFSRGKNWFRTFLKTIVIALTKLIGTSFFLKKLQKTHDKIKKSAGTSFLGCVVWPVYGKCEILTSEIFSDTSFVEFEGEQFPAPIGYDTYLRSLYGIYEEDPPLEKQKTHHGFCAYKVR